MFHAYYNNPFGIAIVFHRHLRRVRELDKRNRFRNTTRRLNINAMRVLCIFPIPGANKKTTWNIRGPLKEKRFWRASPAAMPVSKQKWISYEAVAKKRERERRREIANASKDSTKGSKVPTAASIFFSLIFFVAEVGTTRPLIFALFCYCERNWKLLFVTFESLKFSFSKHVKGNKK